MKYQKVILSLALTMTLFLSINNAFTKTLDIKHDKLRFQKNHLSLEESPLSKYLVVVRERINFKGVKQRKKLELAIDLLEEIINSEEFKIKVLSYMRNSNGERGYSRNYLWNNAKQRLSSEEIYNIIIRGDEKKLPNTIGEMNINIQRYRSPWWNRKGKRVIGYTNPSSSKWIYVNSRWYNRFEVSQMVANITHEWIHLLGFLHGQKNVAEEVPYVLGRIAGDIAKKILSYGK